ncbi:hypothetical protein [Eggerthella guodeyinii]|uniref:Uncharacterized protein n=1 Tax=Eggerthella guodeyinii TaxID=2690837 RepID=A0A6N7RJP4_9ACTN|nr:hypothetical protein [Eggerthella guodeyinii]MRX81130.1 hypothetical protein [Eggerthella guodeyinii]
MAFEGFCVLACLEQQIAEHLYPSPSLQSLRVDDAADDGFLLLSRAHLLEERSSVLLILNSISTEQYYHIAFTHYGYK